MINFTFIVDLMEICLQIYLNLMIHNPFGESDIKIIFSQVAYAVKVSV